MKTLVTGGIRSGKSAYAEGLLDATRPARYIATGAMPSADDPDWTARVEAHRGRRPAPWSTVETPDGVVAITDASTPLILDSLGSWLTSQLTALDAWEQPENAWAGELTARLTTLIDAISDCRQDLVVVTEEVGLTLVSPHRSGRLYADWLGLANQRIAAVCERVVLVVAGCPLVVKPAGCAQCGTGD